MSDDTKESVDQLVEALGEKGATHEDRKLFLLALLRQVEAQQVRIVELVQRIRKAVMA